MENRNQNARKYLDIAGSIMLVIRPDETVELINRRGCDILGYREEEIVGQNWFDRFLPEDVRDRVRKAFHRMLNGDVDPEKSYENAILTRDGEKRVIAWKNTLMEDDAGNIIGTLSSGQDMTERLEAEKALMQSEEQYRLLFRNNPHPMLIYRLEDYAILDVNKSALELYGYTYHEFLDLSILDIRPKEDIPRLMENVRKVSEGLDRAGEWRHIRKDGSIIDVEITSHTITYNGERAEVVLVYDITRRKRAETDLRKSEEKYRKFFEEDLTADYISSPDGRILFCNPAFLTMFGFESESQAMGINVVSLYADPSDRDTFLEQLQREEKLENYEMKLQRLDGSPVFARANIIGRFDPDGNLTEIMGYLYDITQHKRIEEQFFLAQKMEAIGRLAGGVAHDFNNLLSVINGYSDLARHKLPDSNPLKHDLAMVYQAGKKAEALTRQLLAFSRRQVMQPKVVNLNTLVEDLQKMLQRLIGEDVSLLIRLEANPWLVKADPTQVEQVLMNLAVNSRDAMPQGGKLIIESKNVSFSSDMVQERVTMPAGQYVMLAVTDTGVGMAAAIRSSVFEPFFTTKEKGKGTGLGLSTVYGIIKQSGGFIWVYSEPGKGTTFKIYLPRTEAQEEEDIVRSKPVPDSLQGTETILLVEDDDGVRSIGQMILERFGYTVLAAADGNSALKMASGHGAGIRIMITDVVMPGMNGRELAERVMKLVPDIRVLYLSGYTDDAIAHHGILDPGVEFLPKPFDAEELLQRVREILDTEE